MLLPPGEYKLHSRQLTQDEKQNLRSLDGWKNIKIPDALPSCEVNIRLALSDGSIEGAEGVNKAEEAQT
jgi:hypothetical protein